MPAAGIPSGLPAVLAGLGFLLLLAAGFAAAFHLAARRGVWKNARFALVE